MVPKMFEPSKFDCTENLIEWSNKGHRKSQHINSTVQEYILSKPQPKKRTFGHVRPVEIQISLRIRLSDQNRH